MENLTVKELVISTKGKLVLGDENNFVNDIIICLLYTSKKKA